MNHRYIQRGRISHGANKPGGEPAKGRKRAEVRCRSVRTPDFWL